MNTNLSINLNKVALLRNQRDVGYPCPVAAGRTILAAGAHGLTIHPRPDERHIRKIDAHALALFLDEEGHRARGVEFNIEGNPFESWLDLVHELSPDQATLVPDSPDQNTSDHGWDVPANAARLREIIAGLKNRGIRVSLFMDPDPASMKAARDVGADRIELYTGPYAHAFAGSERATYLARYAAAAGAAREVGLEVNAGHDLTTENLPAFKKAIPFLSEVSIGHGFVADALWWGLESTVHAYLKALARHDD